MKFLQNSIKTLNKEFLDLEDFNENPTYLFKYLVGVKGLTSFFARPCIRHLLKCVCVWRFAEFFFEGHVVVGMMGPLGR